jgi:hypothetical protein
MTSSARSVPEPGNGRTKNSASPSPMKNCRKMHAAVKTRETPTECWKASSPSTFV